MSAPTEPRHLQLFYFKGVHFVTSSHSETTGPELMTLTQHQTNVQ